MRRGLGQGRGFGPRRGLGLGRGFGAGLDTGLKRGLGKIRGWPWEEEAGLVTSTRQRELQQLQ